MLIKYHFVTNTFRCTFFPFNDFYFFNIKCNCIIFCFLFSSFNPSHCSSTPALSLKLMASSSLFLKLKIQHVYSVSYLCVCDFRTNHLVLAVWVGVSSLRKAISRLLLAFLNRLYIVLCVCLGPCEIFPLPCCCVYWCHPCSTLG